MRKPKRYIRAILGTQEEAEAEATRLRAWGITCEVTQERGKFVVTEIK